MKIIFNFLAYCQKLHFAIMLPRKNFNNSELYLMLCKMDSETTNSDKKRLPYKIMRKYIVGKIGHEYGLK